MITENEISGITLTTRVRLEFMEYLGFQVACKIITNKVKVITAVNCITQLLEVFLVAKFTTTDHPIIVEPDALDKLLNLQRTIDQV